MAARWVLLLAAIVALFFWKILFTGQFTMLWGWEEANQWYAWNQFAVSSVQKGVLPSWDPYTFSGRTFLGEMQTGVFYPLKILLYLWPLPDSGLLSPRLFHEFRILGHFLAACFMFWLAIELGITSYFAAFVSALCFALGGFLAKAVWEHLFDGAIWTPLVLIFLLRSLRSRTAVSRVLCSCLTGLALGMAILAGSVHIPTIHIALILSASIFFVLSSTGNLNPHTKKFSRYASVGGVVLLVAIVSFLAGAVQLLPSIEYSGLAIRFTESWTGLFNARIPYASLSQGSAPRSVLAFLFGAAPVGKAEVSPYFGVVPLLLAVFGAWRNWEKPWVRYLTGLAAIAYLYTLGEYSFLHGSLYFLVPYLDKTREAGRFILLTHLAMALLAGFGAQSLFARDPDSRYSLSKLARTVQWTAVVVLIALGIPTIYGKPEVEEWGFVSLIILLGAWLMLLYILKTGMTGTGQFIVVFLILFDLYVFDWPIQNRGERERQNQYHLGSLLVTKDLADFLKRQPGLFRIHMQGDALPNIGDVFGVPTTGGNAASSLQYYLSFLQSPPGLRLLNVRYIVSREMEGDRVPVFAREGWSVYERDSYCPRAWVVRRVVPERSTETVLRRLGEPGFDPMKVAYISEALPVSFNEQSQPADRISFGAYQADHFELTVHASSPGLLVLSEMHYPGWEAMVNGTPAYIYKVDGLLRGVLIPAGTSRVSMRYRPASVRIGAVATLLTFAGTLMFAGIVSFRQRRQRR